MHGWSVLLQRDSIAGAGELHGTMLNGEGVKVCPDTQIFLNFTPATQVHFTYTVYITNIEII